MEYTNVKVHPDFQHKVKRKLEFVESLQGLALEYIDLIELNRQNRRGFMATYKEELTVFPAGVVKIKYRIAGAAKVITVSTAYSTGETYYSKRSGLIQLGEASAEVIADGAQTIFVCISWKIKRASMWEYVKFIWRQVASKFRGLR